MAKLVMGLNEDFDNMVTVTYAGSFVGDMDVQKRIQPALL